MTPAPESPDAARQPVPSIAVDKEILDCWRVNYGLHREPHALHEFWRNGAPAGAVLALRAAVLEIERLHASQEEAAVTRLTAERDAALRDAERLRALLTRVLDTREAEAKAWFAAENARNNLSGGAAAEEKAHLRAMHVASVAERHARAALSAQERGNV